MADERITDFNLKYDLIDLTALNDAAISTSDNSQIATITKLKTESNFPDYMTWEHNHNILDGNLVHFTNSTLNPSNNNIAFFSSGKSDSNGDFTSNPIIDISFTEAHTSIGLTLYFVDDSPLNMRVTWKNSGELLTTEEFSITSKVCFIDKSVKMYDQIILEFTKAVPDRYIKMYYILFGKQYTWDETVLKSGKLVQEINMLGDMISINTLNFEVIDVDKTLNFGSSQNVIEYFTRLQPMYPEIVINDESTFLGKYYLEKVTSENNIASFKAFSAIGLLDNVAFNDGTIYENTPAGEVIEVIFSLAGITSYTIDTATYNTGLYGTIKPCTCREALQILFVCGSIVRSNSSDYQIIIEQPTTSLANKIARDVKINTKVSDAEYVTGVKLAYTMYELKDAEEKISTDTYDAGTHLIIFSNPYTNVRLDDTSVTITESNTYYIKFTVPTRRSITIYGTGYNTITSDIIVKRTSMKIGAIENVKSFSTDLCDYLQASSVAYRVLNYYITSSLDISIKTLADNNTMMGKQIVANSVENLSNYVGRYTSRVFDLTGGFIDDSKLVGYYANAGINEYYATGDESFQHKEDMYTGDYLI